MKKTQVVQRAIVFNKEGKILVLFRTETAPTRPLTWDLPGGELDFGEDPRGGMLREVREEAGLEVENLELFDIVSKVSEKSDFDVIICYKTNAKDEKIKLSYEHNDSKWVTPEDFLNLKSSETQRGFVRKLL